MKFLKGFPVPQIFFYDLRRLTMMALVIDPRSESPPIRITPPWVIIGIGIGIGLVIVSWPRIDLFARNHGISIIHFTERFDLLSYHFPCHGDFFPSPEDVRI
jgi:hypothetical protein